MYRSRRGDMVAYPLNKNFLYSKQFGVSDVYALFSAEGFVGAANNGRDYKVSCFSHIIHKAKLIPFSICGACYTVHCTYSSCISTFSLFRLTPMMLWPSAYIVNHSVGTFQKFIATAIYCLWYLQIFAKALAQGHAFGKTATALDVEFLRRRSYTSVYQKIYVKVIGKVLKNEAGYVPLACIETTYSLYKSSWLTLFPYKTSIFIYVGTLDFTITVSKGNHYHCM